jgi:hypothetical protein
MGKFLLVVFALIVFAIGYGATKNDSASPSSRYDPVANTEAKRRWAVSDHRDQANNITIEKWSWHKGGFDNVMIATFTLRNTNDVAVKDIVISCEHLAPSGTTIDTSTRTVYEAIKPKASKTIKNFNMGLIHTQAARSSCVVKDFS